MNLNFQINDLYDRFCTSISHIMLAKTYFKNEEEQLFSNPVNIQNPNLFNAEV